jgi:hypothetical protein
LSLTGSSLSNRWAVPGLIDTHIYLLDFVGRIDPLSMWNRTMFGVGGPTLDLTTRATRSERGEAAALERWFVAA